MKKLSDFYRGSFLQLGKTEKALDFGVSFERRGSRVARLFSGRAGYGF